VPRCKDSQPPKRGADAGIEQALAALFIAAVLVITAAYMLWTGIAQTSQLFAGSPGNATAGQPAE
jgi:hypothetical protein